MSHEVFQPYVFSPARYRAVNVENHEELLLRMFNFAMFFRVTPVYFQSHVILA